MSQKNNNKQRYIQYLAARFGTWLYAFAYTLYCTVGNFVLVNFIYRKQMKDIIKGKIK
jgi:hypothetical protein